MPSFFSHLLTPTCLLALSYHAQAQLCGGGSKSITVYTQGGEEISLLKYEAFTLTETALDTIQADFRAYYRNEGITYCEGVTVRSPVAHRLASQGLIQPTNTSKPSNNQLLKNGMVSFPTGPHSENLLLVRIYSLTKEAYILGSFFCGCRNSIDVLWEFEPRIGYRK
jgi:hypothetical protein